MEGRKFFTGLVGEMLDGSGDGDGGRTIEFGDGVAGAAIRAGAAGTCGASGNVVSLFTIDRGEL